MSTGGNEGNVRAPFSKDSLQVRHSDGTWAKGGTGNASQLRPQGPWHVLCRATAACWHLRALSGLKNE